MRPRSRVRRAVGEKVRVDDVRREIDGSFAEYEASGVCGCRAAPSLIAALIADSQIPTFAMDPAQNAKFQLHEAAREGKSE